MGKGVSVTVGDVLFPTKTALIEHVRELIARHPVGADVEGRDREFFLALFRFHPEASSKLASGVRRLEVRLDEFGNKHFQVHRLDGTDDDISWHWCVRHAK